MQMTFFRRGRLLPLPSSRDGKARIARAAPLLAAALALVAATTTSAQAALWGPFDLRTLVVESKYIVLAEVTKTRTVATNVGNFTLTTYRIKKVYKGPMLPGQVIEVRDDYPRKSWLNKVQAFDPEAVIFLKDLDPESPRSRWARRLQPKDAPEYEIVHSGLRLLKDNRVYSFIQIMNPGPISPTPEYRELPGGRREHLALGGFEKELAQTIGLVEAFFAAAKMENASRTRAEILSLLKAYEEDAKRYRTKTHALRVGDGFLRRVIQHFIDAGDIGAALEVMARTGSSGPGIGNQRLLDAAADGRHSASQRAVAIAAMNPGDPGRADRDMVRRLVDLANDRDLEVARAAIRKLASWYRTYKRMKDRQSEEETRFWRRAMESIEAAEERALKMGSAASEPPAAAGAPAPPAPAAGPVDEAGRPLIKKLGTIACDLVETTPVVLRGKVYRFQWVRNRDCFNFVEREGGKPTPDFAKGYRFGSAFVEGETVYVTGTKTEHGWYGHTVTMFVSRDLKEWKSRTVLDDPKYGICNTSLCKAGDRYVLMFEIHKPPEETGAAFTARFATSRDLKEWEVTPATRVYAKDRYSAPHCLRYLDGYFYNFYLEAHQGYEQRVVRSRDLVHWKPSPLNPVLRHSDADKQIASDRLTPEERQRIAGATNLNNSDIDFCEHQGKLIINYSWGNQQGVEFLAEAIYEGTEEQFLRGWFP